MDPVIPEVIDYDALADLAQKEGRPADQIKYRGRADRRRLNIPIEPAEYTELRKQHKAKQDKINQQRAIEQQKIAAKQQKAATKIQRAVRAHTAASKIKTAQQKAKQDEQEAHDTTVALIEAQKAAEKPPRRVSRLASVDEETPTEPTTYTGFLGNITSAIRKQISRVIPATPMINAGGKKRSTTRKHKKRSTTRKQKKRSTTRKHKKRSTTRKQNKTRKHRKRK